MAEQLHLQATSREERYQELYPQLQSLTCRETNLIANLANTAAGTAPGLRLLLGRLLLGGGR